MKAVVMAGGEGSRLRPLTIHRPKPLVAVGCRPIMEYVLDLLRRHGLTHVVATLHYMADQVQATFADGVAFGVTLEYSHEETPLGTAGSVKAAQGSLEGETFLIMSGDALTDCDLSDAIHFHRAKGGVATLVLKRVPNPLEYGVVITDDDGRVQRFLEKPTWSEVFSDTVNTGIYILEPEVLDIMEAGRSYDWSRDIFPYLLAEGKPMFGYVMEGYWADVGSLEQLRQAHEDLLSGHVGLSPAGEQVSEGIWIGKDCVVDPDVVLEPPVCLGEGVRIKGDARIGPATCIDAHSLVESGAIVERSFVGESAYLGPATEVRGAAIGARVTVKRDTTVHEDVVIGDHCLIDVGCTIRPRVRLWPDKVVERGSTLTMSLVYGNRWRGTLFRSLGVAGLSNIEITPEFATRLGSAFGTCLPARSKVVASRDSTRSSRMIKRAAIASLMSVGCDVLDLRSAPVPVARHFIRASGALGAVNVRKLPGNSRVTLIEFFDADGLYLEKQFERKVEGAFYREDFRRTDPDDLGEIEFASRAIDEYQHDFYRCLEAFIRPEGGPVLGGRKRIRLVCDYGYSALAAILPPMLERLGVEAVSLNTFNNAKMAPRSPEEMGRHLENVRSIVDTLGYDLGVLFTNEGERLTCVDDEGRIVSGIALAGVLGSLLATSEPGTSIALTTTSASRMARYLESLGSRVLCAKADVPSLMRAALAEDVRLGCDDEGGFVFPHFHSGFDAAFALASLVGMLQDSATSISHWVDQLPPFSIVRDVVPCGWEAKGAVMRSLASAHPEADLNDGIKIWQGDDWVMALPDPTEPWIHVLAEAGCQTVGEAHLAALRREVETLVGEAS